MDKFYYGMYVLEKAFGKDGGELWAIVGNRSGGNKSDWRRVYKARGVEYLRLRGQLVRLDNYPNYMVYEIMEDGEVRDR